MVRKNSNTAVIDPPARPHDIAAKVAAHDIETRLAAARTDIEEWRRIAWAIADGHEPTGKELAAIGDLTRRLRLPPDSLGEAVRAIQTERRHQAEVERVRSSLVDIKAREPELVAEIKAAEQRVRELHAEVLNYQGIQAGYPYSVQAANAVRQENPLIFAEVEHVAQRLVAAESGMASGTIKGMVPQPATLQGHVKTKGAWGT
jgi:hypothetical protein